MIKPRDPKTSLMVVGHGTTSQEGVSQFSEVIDHLRERVAMPVGHGFIELSQPDIATGIETLLSQYHSEHVIVLPLLLLGAGHVKTDVPAAIVDARRKFRNVRFTYGRNLSIGQTLLEIVEDRARNPYEMLQSSAHAVESADFTLLVGRGSTDPDANSDLYKLARLLTERKGLGEVEPAFVSLAKPGVVEALDRLKRLGATGITVAPYFLFAGVLLDRIYAQARVWQSRNTNVTLLLAREMGADARIAELLARRSQEGRSTNAMNCDICIYKEKALTAGG